MLVVRAIGPFKFSFLFTVIPPVVSKNVFKALALGKSMEIGLTKGLTPLRKPLED